MRTNVFLFATAMLFATGTALADNEKMLVNTKTGGSPAEYTLDNVSKIVFGADNFTIVGMDGQSAAYDYEDIREIQFDVKGEPSDIKRVAEGKLRLSATHQNLFVSGWNQGETVASLYRADGTLCRKISRWNGEPINISGLNSGIYILKINKTTFKFKL